jgi:hypothetical protein
MLVALFEGAILNQAKENAGRSFADIQQKLLLLAMNHLVVKILHHNFTSIYLII